MLLVLYRRHKQLDRHGTFLNMFRLFLSGVFLNAVRSFHGYNLLWHALAIGLTFGLVTTGVDWSYFEYTRGDTLFFITLPAAIGGFFIPIILPVGMYVIGGLRKNSRLLRSSAILAQAEIIALLISSTYKAFTGRIQPEFLTHLSNIDVSHQFNFGFLQHGIFWGWPSSHTAVAFAMAATIFCIYPRSRFLRYMAALYALYIAFGVSISVHWLSDVVAGAIIGTAIGSAVARNFRQ